MTQPLSDEAKELAAGYVLGELDAEEETRLQQLLRENPALTQEVQALSAVYRLLPQALPQVEPPAELRSRILSAQAELDAEQPGAAAGDGLDMLQERRSQRWAVAGRSHSRAGRFGLPWGAIASVAAGVTILALGLDNLRLRQQVAQVGSGGGRDARAIAPILQRPNSRLVALQDPSAPAAGTVLFTPGRWDEVVVSMENLPALPPDQTYRLWLRLQDGTVILCGEFIPDDQGRVFATLTPPQQPTPDNRAASVFITVESQRAPAEPQGSPVVGTEL
ncbi:anti-sigma factor [Thermoleptolyngbya sp. C42_A2020_037]|uniref:anti-sigma factor n=1 Tax=Thermoleptolyngbya sp. C42_A2020_037 TaxID=2747799 RepID=UPI0019E458BD|nr:anti-sigma factor [Thermoleptolyngbya sp. C42_A2020_037]MBF2085057.1 anti-sigma factor [Thermoleptolyngbya sp. C42_A2020_037]